MIHPVETRNAEKMKAVSGQRPAKPRPPERLFCGNMNSDLITKLNRLLEFIKQWQPDMRLSGVVDYGTLCSSSSLPKILRQVILALRAEGKDGLASHLEDDWTVFASDIGERDSKDYSTSSKSERDICRRLTDEWGICLDKEQCPRDAMWKVFHIASSKRNLIETIIATLRVMQAVQEVPRQDMANRPTMKEPPKEYRIAYQLTRIQGFKQEVAAAMMAKEGYKTSTGGKVEQDIVSRWAAKWADWQAYQNLPVEQNAPRAGKTITNHDVIVQGKRTDGRNPQKKGF